MFDCLVMRNNKLTSEPGFILTYPDFSIKEN